MRVRSKTIVGRIGPRGELNAPWDVMAEFLSLHKGKAVILRAEIQPVEATEKTRNYFFGYVLPEIQNAFMEQGEHLTKAQTYDRLRDWCPLFHEEKRENGKWRDHVKEFEELDQAQVNEVIDWLFQFSAENLNLILDNPQ